MELHAQALKQRGRKTALFKIMKQRGRENLSSGVWARALEHDDELAIELVERAMNALAAGIASAVNLLDVEAVVIGGGLGTRLGEPYVAKIRERMVPHLFVDRHPPVVRVAALGDLGGAIGAALQVPSDRAVTRCTSRSRSRVRIFLGSVPSSLTPAISSWATAVADSGRFAGSKSSNRMTRSESQPGTCFTTCWSE